MSYIYSTCKNQCQPEDVKQKQAQAQQAPQQQSASAPLPPMSSLDLDPKCMEDCKLAEGMASCTAFFDVCLNDCENFLKQLKPIDKQQLECEQDCVDNMESCAVEVTHPSPKLSEATAQGENMTKTLTQDYLPQNQKCVQTFLPCLKKCAQAHEASLKMLFADLDDDILDDFPEISMHVPRAPRGGRKIPVERFLDDDDFDAGGVDDDE